MSSKPSNLPLIVGVTGSMDLHATEIPILKAQVRQILDFLKHGRDGDPRLPTVRIGRLLDFLELSRVGKAPNLRARVRQILRALRRIPVRDPERLQEWVCDVLGHLRLDRSAEPPLFAQLLAMMPKGRRDRRGRRLPRPFEEAFASWGGMPNTDILVLSSLAPGADSLVAEVALETDHCTVKAPLPFPPDIYEKSDRFVRDDERQQYRNLLARVKEENTFAVRLRGEQAEPTDQQDNSDPRDRTKRYYAAGEYIARHAHLLIAISDHEHDKDSTHDEDSMAVPAAVVKARQHGPRRGVLDGDIGVGLPPGGPTLHRYTCSQNNPNGPKDPPPFQLRVLLPEPLPGEDEPHEHADRKVDGPSFLDRIVRNLRRVLRLEPPPEEDEARERNEQEAEALNLFGRIAQNLDAFNATPVASEDKVDEEMDRRFKDKAVREALKYKWPDMYTAFRNLGRWRRRAADRGYELGEKHAWSLFALFWLTFLAASFFHFCAHWHVEAGPEDHSGWARVAFGLGALVMTGTSIALYSWCKPKRYAERGNDYRALAEGLRVQLHWNLAGLGQSVPANYMHRQRSELDWIRAAVRAASFPYHRFRDWFAQLPPDTQLAALSGCLEPGWIIDQKNYFKDSTKKNHRLLHFFHKLAGWLAWTGVLTLAGAFACSTMHLESWSAWLIPGALVLLTGWWGLGWLVRYGGDEYKPKRLETRWDRLLWKLIWLVDRITPARESHTSPPRGFWGQWWRLVRDFLLLLVPSAAVAVLLLAVVHQPRWCDSVPAPEDMAIIFGGILLLGGALLVAWVEKALYSELAYQYGTMMTLFECAHLQWQRSREELYALPPGSDDYCRKLKEIQEFLFALGKEALDENAEWLILHRARPLEPVMAG